MEGTTRTRLLGELIPSYAQLKEEEKGIKGKIKKTNEKIKTELREGRELHAGDKIQYEVGDYVATLSVQDRSTTDSETLIEVLKELGFEEAIKTIEVPDEDVVEKLIYEGRLEPHDIDGCIIVNEVETLKITKAKKGK